MDKILTVNNVAEVLQVKPITIREMFREKRLRGFKVGKAWRTTEKMLQEDIAALARGESPESLPHPGSPPAARVRPAGKPSQGADTESDAEATPAKAGTTKKTARKKADEDDNQAMLF